MTKQPTLGTGAPLDVEKLIESRMLIQANSGGGKSYCVRRICEQTYSFAPQIIFDVEGEFHTLREKYDYILAAPKGGDCVADIKSAALLMRKVLELGVSVIIDIYELGTQRGLFIKRALEALVNSPRDLWRSLIVVVDEVHKFAPEGEKCESTSAVIDLFTLGRKRGFCGIGATQRISKVHKDLAAECNNKLVGRCVQDIDIVRAAKELGFTSRADAQNLRNLEPGEFWAFGPALTNGVNKIKIGPVKTTHPKSGARALAPTPPSDRIRKILGQLDNLPREAEEELRTVGELKLKVRQLETELRKKPVVIDKAEKIQIVEKQLIKPADLKRLESIANRLETRASMLGVEVTTIKEITNRVTNFHRIAARGPIYEDKPTNGVRPIDLLIAGTAKALREREPKIIDNSKPLPPGEAIVLRAAIQFADGLFKKQLTTLAGYKLSTRNAYIARLRDRGYLIDEGARIRATAEGIAAMPDAEPLPVGEALRDYWIERLPSGERAVFELLINAYPNSIEKPDIDDNTGFKVSTRNAYLARLAAKELVVDAGSATVKANDTLFEER
jgi:hypothetical protein